MNLLILTRKPMKLSTSFAIHQLNLEMNRVAEHTLKSQLGLSYSRFYCLLSIDQHSGTTQHSLARAMGYSDPAISRMLSELNNEGLVEISVDPTHMRRRTVTLSRAGIRLLDKSTIALDKCFADAATSANIQESSYSEQTQALISAMQHKNKEQ